MTESEFDPQDADDVESEMSISPTLRVGCSDLPPNLRRQRYFERLDYLENEGTFAALPKTSAVAKWRREAGELGRFGLVAPQVITHRPGPRGYPRSREVLPAEVLAQAGGFRDTPVVRESVDALAEVTGVLGTDAVLFRSPPDFAPSAANRDLLRQFFGEVATAEKFGQAARVWEPQGLWQPELAAPFAAELGVVYACDPLANDPFGVGPEFYAALPGGRAYFRITGLGSVRHRLDEYVMDALHVICGEYEQVWVVFAHVGKYPDAIRFRGLGDI